MMKYCEQKELISPWVYVDRTDTVFYPIWVKAALHEELEKTLPGPAEFDVEKLEQWLHPEQKYGRIKGKVIHQELKENGMLKNCLGLQDLDAIQKKGITFFKKHFNKKWVFGWKSVALSRYGRLVVPYLRTEGCQVCICWYWLNNKWCGNYPALLFPKSP